LANPHRKNISIWNKPWKYIVHSFFRETSSHSLSDFNSRVGSSLSGKPVVALGNDHT